MVVRTELYAPSPASADQLWAVVGDPWRLAEWTDADSVDSVAPQPVEKGTEIVGTSGGQVRTWHVTNVGPRLLEVATDVSKGVLTVGWRAVRQERGSRLVLAAQLEPRGRMGLLRRQLVELPALRRLLDRWSADALRAAGE